MTRTLLITIVKRLSAIVALFASDCLLLVVGPPLCYRMNGGALACFVASLAVMITTKSLFSALIAWGIGATSIFLFPALLQGNDSLHTTIFVLWFTLFILSAIIFLVTLLLLILFGARGKWASFETLLSWHLQSALLLIHFLCEGASA